MSITLAWRASLPNNPNMLPPVFVLWSRCLLCNDFFQASNQVYALCRMRPRVLCIVIRPHPMTKVECEEQWQTDIGSEEAADAPSRGKERVEPIDECQNPKSDDGDPRSPWLHPAVVWLVTVLDTLSIACLAEAEVGDCAADPRDKRGFVGEVDKPVEHNCSSRRYVEVGEEAVETCGCDSRVRNAILAAPLEIPRGIA